MASNKGSKPDGGILVGCPGLSALFVQGCSGELQAQVPPLPLRVRGGSIIDVESLTSGDWTT